MNPIWFLRMAKWAKNPPSAARVKLVLAVVAFCAALALFEWVFGWPDWLTTTRLPRVGVRF